MIANLLHKQSLRKIQREKEKKQALCSHKFVDVGTGRACEYDGYEEYYYTQYYGYCPHCDLTLVFNSQAGLNMEIAKQQARDSAGRA